MPSHPVRPHRSRAAFAVLTLASFATACSDPYNAMAPAATETEVVQVFTDHTSPAVSAASATVGQWTPTFPWVNVAVHLSVLPNGKVLSFGRLNGGTPQLWDPVTNTFTGIPSPSLMFCAGQAYLPNGKLLVAGGHIQDGLGLPNSNTFEFSNNTWTAGPSMAKGRWYPTATSLGTGEVLVIAGTDQNGTTVQIPEVWKAGTWRSLPGAARSLPYYPRNFLAPNGEVFYAGELQQTYYINTAGAGSWTFVANRVQANRYYGAAVMYRPGLVLYVGGGDPPTATAEVIDINPTGNSQWRPVGSMANARQQLNLTMLPDGRVLATGGTSAPGFSNPAGGVHDAEVWDPSTEQWSTWASNAVTRVYHSGTVLLPDGRLVFTGSGDGAGLPNELTGEIFEPPYLFQGPRPVISTLSATAFSRGAKVKVTSPNAASISLVSLVRLNSTTHAHDMNQRWMQVSFTLSGNMLTLKIPSDKNRLPSGYYMLFILDGNRIPSVARIVRVK